MKLLIDKVKNLLKVESYKHLTNYLIFDIINKGVVFLAIPLLTFLLPVEDYGKMSIFLTMVNALIVIFGGGIKGAINRFYYDNNIKINSFLWTNIIFLFLYNVVLIIILLLFKDKLITYLDIDWNIYLYGLIAAALWIPIDMHYSYLQASKQSKKYSYLSFFITIGTLFFTLILAYLLKEDKYLSRVFGRLVLNIIGIVIIFYSWKKIRFEINIKDIIVLLGFGFPLIAHNLSGIVMAFIDRIIINKYLGPSEVGIYSFAYDIAMVMNVLVMAVNRAWLPLFYEGLQKKNIQYLQHNLRRYSIIVFLFGITLCLLLDDVIPFITPYKYDLKSNLVPLIVLSFIFIYFYTLVANYTFYLKRTILVSIFSIFTAILNIILNIVFIPKYGIVAAAYSTFTSYFILFLAHYIHYIFWVDRKIKINFNFIYVDTIILVLLIVLKFVINHYSNIINNIIISSVSLLIVGFIKIKSWKKLSW